MPAASEDRTLTVSDELWNVARIVEDGVGMIESITRVNPLARGGYGRDPSGRLYLLGYRSIALDSSSTSLSAAATDDDDKEQRGSSKTLCR